MRFVTPRRARSRNGAFWVWLERATSSEHEMARAAALVRSLRSEALCRLVTAPYSAALGSGRMAPRVLAGPLRVILCGPNLT